MRILVIMPLCAVLGGCAVVAHVDARNDYQASAANYKRCLASGPPQACESLRVALEVDERRYNNLTAGMSDGQRSGTLTILNR